MQEDDVFDESLTSYTDDGLTGITWKTRDSVAGHVKSFAEIITEWFLFDSSYEKDIKSFLMSESMDDVLNESEFIDLIWGKAYLKDDLVQLISLKLPFKITLERLQILNNETKKSNPKAYLITKFVADKIKDLSREKSEIKIQKEKARKHKKDKKYYLKNREYIIAQKKKYYESNKQKILTKKKENYNANREYYRAYLSDMYQKHKEQRKKDNKQHYEDNKEEISAKRKKHYREHPEEYAARRKKYYEEHKSDVLRQQKEYIKEHHDEIQQKRKQYYERHKKELTAKSNEARKKNRQIAKMARNVCAVYLFLIKLQKENEELYSKLYTKYQNPVLDMMKTCVALQSMNFDLCPLINNTKNYTQCGCAKVFDNFCTIDEIQKYIQILKQKNNQK